MLDYFFPDMRLRNTSDRERLELAATDSARARRTVRQFKRINYLLSGSGRLLRNHVFTIMARNPERRYTLLEVGAGGCDIAVWAAREARRRGLRLNITALDQDRRSLALAVRAVRDYPEIRLVEGNALDLGALGPFDFVYSNHFLHHLSWDDMQRFLAGVLPRTRLALVMNDLKRSPWAYLGFTIFGGLLTPGSFHHYDGRLSIRRGFLPAELREFLHNHFPEKAIQVVETCPARVVLIHTTDPDSTQPDRGAPKQGDADKPPQFEPLG